MHGSVNYKSALCRSFYRSNCYLTIGGKAALYFVSGSGRPARGKAGLPSILKVISVPNSEVTFTFELLVTITAIFFVISFNSS